MTTTHRRSPGTDRPRRTLVRSAAALAVGSSLALSGGVAAGARADGPTGTPIDRITTTTVYDLCAFPVEVTSEQVGTLLDFTDASGAGQLIFHGSETDAFTGPNGTTLQGTPYHGMVRARIDSQGNYTLLDGSGVQVNVPLRNGSTFFAAGRVEFLKRFQDDFIAVPDAGTSRNLDEFCRELAG